MIFNEFVKKYNRFKGIKNPTNPSVNLQGQCVSIVRAFMVEVLEISLNNIHGDAKEYWYKFSSMDLPKYFDKIAYTKGMSFKKGDIFILGAVPTNQYGHIGVCFGDWNANQFHIFDSNYNNNKTCLDRLRGYDGLLGILRPKEFLQSKINGNIEPLKWINPYPTLKIDKATTKDGYPVRIEPMSKETIYHAKVDDYLTVLEISSCPLDDGFKWAKVLTYGNDTGYIQIDLDYMHVEV